MILHFCKQAVAGQSLLVYSDGQQTRCFCNIKDIVRAVIELMNEPRIVGEIFNVVSCH